MFPNPQSTTTYSTHIVLHITKTQLLILCFAIMKFQVMKGNGDLPRKGEFVHLLRSLELRPTSSSLSFMRTAQCSSYESQLNKDKLLLNSNITTLLCMRGLRPPTQVRNTTGASIFPQEEYLSNSTTPGEC